MRVAVMEVEVVMRYGPRFQQPNGRPTAGREERLLRLLVGDTSGARSQLSVPYQKRRDPCGHPLPITCEWVACPSAFGQIAVCTSNHRSCNGYCVHTSARMSPSTVCTMSGSTEAAFLVLSRYDAIRTGETAEVVVLSRSRKFESFKVPAI